MPTRKQSRRSPSRAPSRGRSSGKSSGPGPLLWVGAGVAAWLVWSLTSPGTAGAASLPPSSLPSATPSPEPRAPSPSSSLLKRGSQGVDVLAWQTTLVYGGYLPDAPSSRDSSFGPLTEAATKVFQQKAGITVDGVVGPDTRAAAKRLISNPAP